MNPRPPTRCTCGHTRLNHPGGTKCRLCTCRAHNQEVIPGRPLPKEPDPQPVYLRGDGRPRTALAVHRIQRDQEIYRLADNGVTRVRISRLVGAHLRTVERVIQRRAA